MNRSLSLFLGVLFSLSLAAAQPPNVIVVVADDQGYGDLSCHGNPVVRTPHLDRLHDESVRFTDFHVAPMCTPTRGQLMTGVDALRNGAMNVSSGRTLLRTEFPTLPKLLAKSGYATGIFGKWHLGDNYPFRPQDRGFQESVWFPSSHIGSVPDAWNNDYFDDTYLHQDQRQTYQGYTTDVFFREAMTWMENQKKADKPFFVYLPTAAPHSPLYVPEKYREAVRPRLEAALDQLPPLAMADRENLIRFLAMIENLDENMGRLESFLSQQKLRDNTLLIFLTDNGSTMGHKYYNAGMKGSKVTLWEGGHRVPLFMRWPNGQLGEARDDNHLTQVQDLLPTLLELCGAQEHIPERLDGISLAPLLKGTAKTFPDRMLVVNYSRMPVKAMKPQPNNLSVPKKDGAAVLWKRWRLLENSHLYDLETDPLQENDVSAAHAPIVEKMRQHLDTWWQGLESRVNEPQRVVIGSTQENPTNLTACEWWDVFVDQQSQIRQGQLKNSHWYLTVAEAGEYEVELRRWPEDSGLSIQASAPEESVTDGLLPEGKALPITQARLQLQGQEFTQKVTSQDQAVLFKLALKPGDAELKTDFLDTAGASLCGAYYARIRKL